MPPFPRPTGAGFEPYVWAATVADVAARHRLSPAHVLRFDANLPPFAARVAVSPRRALAARGEYPEGSYRELREAAAAYAGCAPDELAVDAGAAGLRVGYCVASPRLAAELSARRSPAPIPTSSATLATAALQRAEIEPELRATTAERERVRAALLAAGFDAPPTHTNFVVVRTPQARTLAGQLERRGLVVRAYRDFLRITVRSPADDDLLLAALGVHAPSASTRAATVLGPGIRVSLVIDGSGRATSATGDEARDSRIEERAQEEGIDLELVAEAGLGDERVQ